MLCLESAGLYLNFLNGGGVEIQIGVSRARIAHRETIDADVRLANAAATDAQPVPLRAANQFDSFNLPDEFVETICRRLRHPLRRDELDGA